MPKEKRRHVFFSFNFQPARWLASSQTHTYTLCGTSSLTPTKSPSIWLFAFLFLSACLLPTSFYGSLYVRLVNVDLTHSAAFFHVFWFRIHSISAFIHFSKLRFFVFLCLFLFLWLKVFFSPFPSYFFDFFFCRDGGNTAIGQNGTCCFPFSKEMSRVFCAGEKMSLHWKQICF